MVGAASTPPMSGSPGSSVATHGMYSIWNWNKGLYDYYQVPEGKRPSYGLEVNPPPPAPMGLGSVIGEDPDVSGHVLPSSAKLVGGGALAMGEVVSARQEPMTRINPWLGVVLAIAVPTALLYVTANLFGGERAPTMFEEFSD